MNIVCSEEKRTAVVRSESECTPGDLGVEYSLPGHRLMVVGEVLLNIAQ